MGRYTDIIRTIVFVVAWVAVVYVGWVLASSLPFMETSGALFTEAGLYPAPSELTDGLPWVQP